MHKLIKLELESMLHRSYALWIDTVNNDLLYGPNQDNLSYPEGLEVIGRFPPLHLKDIMKAFLLGKEYGRSLESYNDEEIADEDPTAAF